MTYYGIFAALLVALLLTLAFSGSYRHRGPLRGLFVFFLILFLASWAGQLWISPVGPYYLGVSWVPMIVVPIVIAFILIAAAGPVDKKANNTDVETSIAAVGIFFWLLLMILLFSVVVGYFYYVPPLVKP
jgi:hypothetical protein